MTIAKGNFIRMSPQKLRRVINVIRGKDTHEANIVLEFMPYSAAKVIQKVLKSVVANAKENDKLNPDELRISKAYVDSSSVLKRWRAMSRGRGYPIMKRTSHITIEVSHDPKLAGRKISPAKKQIVHDHKHDIETKHETGSKKQEAGSKKQEITKGKVRDKKVKDSEIKEVKGKTKDLKKKKKGEEKDK